METNVAVQKTEIDALVEQAGLEKTTQSMLIASFVPFLQKVQQWKKDAEALVVTDATQTAKMKMAREARLELKRIRNEADKTRKMLKEDSLRYGKAVQGIYNIIEYTVVPIEEHLERQEKFVEIQEQKEKEARAELRRDELKPYEMYVPVNVDLINMSDSMYAALLDSVKQQHEAQIEFERKEAERKEAERLENERIRLENERLKKEAEERERIAREEMYRIQHMIESRSKILIDMGMVYNGSEFNFGPASVHMVDVKTYDDVQWGDTIKTVKEAVRVHKEEMNAQELKRKEEEAKKAEAIAAEQERLRKAQAEIDAAKAKALEEERQRQAEAERLAMAGDEEKLAHLIAKIESVKLSLPDVSSEKAKVIVKDVESLLGKVIVHIQNKMK